MGGDILYRWGNPSNYGFFGLQVIPNAVHDPRWIPNDGRPYGGFLQIFNNIENFIAKCIPIKIASPCLILFLYPVIASMACPKVWPKFNNSLIPFSFSSIETIFDFIEQLFFIA